MLKIYNVSSRRSVWIRLINSSPVITSNSSRNHHVMSSAENWPTPAHQKECHTQNTFLHKAVLQRISLKSPDQRRGFSLSSVAAASTWETVSKTALTIPDAPANVEESFQALNALGEPTLAALGLGGWSPIGLLQNGLEFLHVSMDLPWWAAIAVSTLIIRVCLTPLVVIAQRNMANMANVSPEMTEIQAKITEARQMGNDLMHAQMNQELMELMQRKGFNPIKSMIIPFAQMPIFLSYFIGLRRMVAAPVESLHTGGMLWFTDLTLVDPYYLLPLITCGTLALTIKFGTDGANLRNQSPLTLYIFRALPVVIFPFIMNFPAALVCYWASSNLCSLVQGAIFRVPKVRTFFNIPQIIKHPPSSKQMDNKKSFVENVKGAWSNMKLSREVEDRRRIDRINFERAAQGPLVRTYKYDPTKVKAKSTGN